MRVGRWMRTAFMVAPGGAKMILHSFPANSNGGWDPTGGLMMDGAGNLYGTTGSGGTPCQRSGGCGTVFEIAPDNTESVLHAFQGGNDGEIPGAGVVIDSASNLYGTTYAGGGAGCSQSQGCGTVFSLTPSGTESVLFAFKKGRDGDRPVAPLLLLGKKLYGTTPQGGKNNNGVVFSLTK